MNDLSRMRTVLHQHADAVEDHAHPERITAVHGRVRAVRRRRMAGVAAAAVLVVAAGTVAVTLPRHQSASPADAPSRMVGHAVPRTTTSLGASYRYVRGYSDEAGRLSVNLPATKTEYLVRMASADAKGQLSLSERGAEDEWVTPAGDFGEFYVIAADQATRISVRQRGGSGAVALAVYEFDRPAPGSYEKAGIVYAPTAAGQPLLGAWIGDAGEAAHTLRLPSLPGTPTKVDVRTVCSNLPRGSMLKVAFAGRPGYISEGTQCEGRAEHLPGEYADSSTVTVPRGVAGLRISVVDSHEQPVGVPANARIGLGVYTPASTGAVHGLAQFIDDAGHRWKLSHTYVAPRGQETASAAVDGRQPALVNFGAVHGSEKGTLVTTLGDQVNHMSGGGMSWAVVADGRNDTTVHLRFKHGGPDVELVVGTYQLAD